ncbi:hypothetical protein [Winogradskyella sp.]|uniref:hypothetical protein n=1 Tax=Winogradskyella sp. TaxID=1883156 RepID=UPI002614A76C|nr:hypothetical protein [Winogradskyella sp.]
MRKEFEKKLGLHGSDDYGAWIKGTRTLRQLIGYLGMLLPVFLITFSNKCDELPLESISHYFYTRSNSFFIVILSLVGIFLIIYTKDFILSSIAGICALCVVFFPTDPLLDRCCIVDIPGNNCREGFHYLSAAIFLVILAYMCIRKFTKLDKEEIDMRHDKVKYKLFYKICGYMMLLSLAIIGLKFLSSKFFPDSFEGFIEFYDENQLTFWMELVALEFFGLAWLVKGYNTIKYSDYRIHLFRGASSELKYKSSKNN